MNIKELAELAGFTQYDFWDQQKQFERFAELVRQDEREACAKLIEDFEPESFYLGQLKNAVRAIRERSKHEQD